MTYQLATTAQGVTISGVPDQVSLAAGASKTFTVTLTAGSATNSAFFEIDADGGESSNTASSVTEVYVTNEQVADQPSLPGALDHITVAPASTSVAAGTAVTYTATGYDASNTSLGSVSDAPFSITPDGSCAGTTCTATSAGPHVVTATTTTGPTTITGTANLTVTAGPAAAVVATSGDGQTTPVNQAFADPLGVRVVDEYDNPVARAPVTFTIASGATFPGGASSANATSAPDGTATSPAVIAGSTDGPITVTVTSGTATPANFTLAATQPTKSRADLDVTLSAPASVGSGAAFTATLRITNHGPNEASKALAVLKIRMG